MQKSEIGLQPLGIHHHMKVTTGHSVVTFHLGVVEIFYAGLKWWKSVIAWMNYKGKINIAM